MNEKYSGLIIISGDGLVHEVVNGLAQRPDWDEISKIPFGIIPGGSGNALNCSILYQLGMLKFLTDNHLKINKKVNRIKKKLNNSNVHFNFRRPTLRWCE